MKKPKIGDGLSPTAEAISLNLKDWGEATIGAQGEPQNDQPQREPQFDGPPVGLMAASSSGVCSSEE